MASVVSQLISSAQTGLPKEIAFDFSALSFIRPAGVVFLSNLLYWLKNVKRCRVSFKNVNPRAAAIIFLDNSSFFKEHCKETLSPLAKPKQTTSPLRSVPRDASHAWLTYDMVPWLGARLGVNAASLAPFKTCLSELFNNIADHTRYDIGGVFSQHFPRGSFPAGNCIETAVADFGIGIPDSVRKVRAGLSDSRAILLSVQEGFTSLSTPRNRGAGLDYLLRTVVLENGGWVTIFSGDAIVRFSRALDGMVTSVTTEGTGFCPGTLIEIKLPADSLVAVADEEEVLDGNPGQAPR